MIWQFTQSARWTYYLIRDDKHELVGVRFRGNGALHYIKFDKDMVCYDWAFFSADDFFDHYSGAVSRQLLNAPLPSQIREFFMGLEHAEAVALKSARGKVAATAIRKEITTLKLKAEGHAA